MQVSIVPVLVWSFSLAKCSYRCIVDGITEGVPPCCGVLIWKVLKGLLKGGHKLLPSLGVCSSSNIDASATCGLEAVQLTWRESHFTAHHGMVCHFMCKNIGISRVKT